MNNTFSSCYGAKPVDDCYTCDSVKQAYDKKVWKYNSAEFKQCNNLASPNTTFSSCYGAKPVDDCYTCEDVKKAYDAKIWKYNSTDFKQCNPATTNKTPPPLPNLSPGLPEQTSYLDNSSSFMIVSLFIFIFIVAMIFSFLSVIGNVSNFIDLVNKNFKIQAKV
jgi:hypothetical protein